MGSKIYFVLICLLLLINGCNMRRRIKRIVGGNPAAKPPPDDPVVFTKMYNRDARVEGFRNTKTGIYSFLGLRFADPPTGAYRFTRPRYRRLEGDINATKHGPPCPQPDSQNPNIVVGNEDCLMLSIYTPKMPDESTGLPVYVWIHPGAFRYGSAAQYDAQPLAQEGVIFVPIQYRLGTLGIIGDGTKEFNGNLAMFDMAAALRWVNEYISFFGGNPKQVKVIGHGSGAASAMYLSTSRLPRSGSITGVVAMSGTSLSKFAKDDEAAQSLQEIAQINACELNNEIEIVSCLRNRSVEDIVMNDSQVQTERLHGHAMIKALAGSVGFNPHVEESDDGRALPGLITDLPEESFSKVNVSAIPLLIGVLKDETGNAINIQAINKIWGSADNFFNSLINTLNDIKSLLPIDELTGTAMQPNFLDTVGLNLSLSDFLRVPVSLSPVELISKVTKVTTDVLFNLPVILSALQWGQTSSAFLYSFEYVGSISKGTNFLSGLPIVSSHNQKNGQNVVAHGDELGYLFDANDIEGNPLPDTQLTTTEDLKVRKNFISMLANFAKPLDDTKNALFRSISSSKGETPFIKINTNLELSADFRNCELALLGAPIKPDKSSCQTLVNTLQITDGVINTLRLPINKNDLPNPANFLG